jgi:hypothetical protein
MKAAAMLFDSGHLSEVCQLRTVLPSAARVRYPIPLCVLYESEMNSLLKQSHGYDISASGNCRIWREKHEQCKSLYRVAIPDRSPCDTSGNDSRSTSTS